MRTKRKILLPLFLLLLFVSYQAGITAFTHAHYVNGVMIVHSHPTKESKHSHTKTQLVVIAQLSSFHTLEAAESFQLFVDRRLLTSFEPKKETSLVQVIHFKTLSLRAPPAVVL